MITETRKKLTMNSLDKIFSAMRNGKYIGIMDTKGNVHCGLVNAILREDVLS